MSPPCAHYGRKVVVLIHGRPKQPNDSDHDLCLKCWGAEKDRARAKELAAPSDPVPPVVVDAPRVIEASRTFFEDTESRIREWELRRRERHTA